MDLRRFLTYYVHLTKCLPDTKHEQNQSKKHPVTGFDAYAKRLECPYHAAVTNIYVLFYFGILAERVFFVIHRLKVNCKVTSLPETFVASAKLHRNDCEYVIALLSHNL